MTDLSQTPSLTGAQILVRSLVQEGVRNLFGSPSSSLCHITRALREEPAIRLVNTHHEAAAVHAADGYARSGGEVGVALVGSGPGATNALTGIATANTDSIPLVVFSSQVHSELIGLDAFQEIDTIGISRPCVKHNFLVKDVSSLAQTVRRAFHIARTGRPGVVLVDIARDAQLASCPFEYPQQVELPTYHPATKGHPGQVRKALAAINAAKSPLLLVGGGAIDERSRDGVRALASALGVPVASTLMGCGVFSNQDACYLGLAGRCGTVTANRALAQCDAVLALGVRFDEHLIACPETFARHERTVIHVDVDPSSISKRVTAHLPIVGNVSDVVLQMLQAHQENPCQCDFVQRASWQRQIGQWKALESESLAGTVPREGLSVSDVICELRESLDESDTVVFDDGELQPWAARMLSTPSPRQWLTAGGFGTTGFALPAAIGAQIAHPTDRIVCLASSVSVLKHVQELSTARRLRLPLRVLLFHGIDDRESVFDGAEAVIEAYGGCKVHISTPAQLKKDLRNALQKPVSEPVIVTVRVTDPIAFPYAGE